MHINKFIRLVSKNLKEEHSVKFYADKLCITPNYLNEIVTSALNVSAKQYIQNKIMDEAKKLLSYTELSISEIAFELHFSTVSYFTRTFRQYTGETALSYRKIINLEKYHFLLHFYCNCFPYHTYLCPNITP